jgi:hypothetical protein
MKTIEAIVTKIRIGRAFWEDDVMILGDQNTWGAWLFGYKEIGRIKAMRPHSFREGQQVHVMLDGENIVRVSNDSSIRYDGDKVTADGKEIKSSDDRKIDMVRSLA